MRHITPFLPVPLILIALLALLPAAASSAEDTWYFGAEPAHTTITFTSRTDLETIIGSTNAISGTATADLDEGTLSRIELVVPVASLRTGVDLRDEHLRSESWLDAARYPNLRFVATSGQRTAGNDWQISGHFEMHGQKRELTVTARVREIPAELAERAGLGEGRWIRVQVGFPITFTDYGIELPGGVAPKVRETWQVQVSLTGGTTRPDNAGTPATGPTSDSSIGEYNLPEVNLQGEGVRYRFGLRPQSSNISIESKTTLETIIVHTNQVAGEAIVNTPDNTGKLKLVVPAASLRTGIAERDRQLASETWLNVEQYPTITFEADDARNVGYLEWEVRGTFTMHGVSKPLTVIVDLRIVGPDALQKAGFAKGDTLTGVHFRTSFRLRFSDFGIRIPDSAAGRVSDELIVTFEALGIEQGIEQ